MALDDFDSIPAGLRPQGPSGSDDEDLFDFPAVDLVGQAAPAPFATPVAAPAPVRTPITAPPQQASPPTNVARAAPTANTPPSAHATPPSPAVETPADETQRGPLPSTKPIARKPALTSVEPELVAAPAAETTESPAKKSRSTRSLPGSRTTWVMLGVLVLNVVGFAILWASNRSYRSGLEGLRDDMAVTMHDLRRSAADSASSAQTVQASTHVEPVPSSSTEHAHSPASPLAPHEETTLLLARQEIDDGEHVQARKRLYRLLAVADRIDAELRKNIEARAMYLVGDSYRRQADTRREKRP